MKFKYALVAGRLFTVISATHERLIFTYNDEPGVENWILLGELKKKGRIPVINKDGKVVRYYEVPKH